MCDCKETNGPTKEQVYFAGIEGGATHSNLLLCDLNGNILVQLKALGTNHWMIGIEECQKRIVDMLIEAKKRAGIPTDTKLKCVGLSLSGCEEEESNNLLKNGLLEKYPDLSEDYVVNSDTIGSLSAAESKGGVVLIYGTGSNALLMNPDKKTYQCGGWGYLLGDEGSAYWISYQAVKVCFDHLDGLNRSSYSIDKVWSLVKEHFQINSQAEILEHCYSKFDKSFFAQLCKKLAILAEKGDALSENIFDRAGYYIAKSIQALYPKADSELLKSKGGLHLVCIGSVWLSWKLLKRGFIERIESDVSIKELSLLRLLTPSALGSVYLAANRTKYNFPKTYEQNYEVFYHYLKSE